jgi:hypothetical protein
MVCHEFGSFVVWETNLTQVTSITGAAGVPENWSTENENGSEGILEA